VDAGAQPARIGQIRRASPSTISMRSATPARVPELACLRSAFRIDLERDHPPRGELFGEVQGGVADGRAHLQHIRVQRPAQRGKEAPRLPVNDRHGVALGHGLHLGHCVGARGAQIVEVALHTFVENRLAGRQCPRSARLCRTAISARQTHTSTGAPTIRATFSVPSSTAWVISARADTAPAATAAEPSSGA
jgi:hypothetical protein